MHLLGLAITDCPGRALTMEGVGDVLLQDVVLSGHNGNIIWALGGAVFVGPARQVRAEQSDGVAPLRTPTAVHSTRLLLLCSHR